MSAQINLPRCAMGCGSTFGLDRNDLPWVWRNGLPPGVPVDRICDPCRNTLALHPKRVAWHALRPAERALSIAQAEGPGRDA